MIETAKKNDNKLMINGRPCEVKIAYPKPIYSSSESQQQPFQSNRRGKVRGMHEKSADDFNSIGHQQCQVWTRDCGQAVSPTTSSDFLNLNPYVPSFINSNGDFIYNYPYINGTYLAPGYVEQYPDDVTQIEKTYSTLAAGPMLYTPYPGYFGMNNCYVPPLFYSGYGHYCTDGGSGFTTLPALSGHTSNPAPNSFTTTAEPTFDGQPATATAGVSGEDDKMPATVTPVNGQVPGADQVLYESV